MADDSHSIFSSGRVLALYVHVLVLLFQDRHAANQGLDVFVLCMIILISTDFFLL